MTIGYAGTDRARTVLTVGGARLAEVMDAELTRALAGLEHLAVGDREAIALLAHRIVKRMVHHLATRLDAIATAPDAETYLAALSFVFDDTGTDDTTVTPAASESDAAQP